MKKFLKIFCGIFLLEIFLTTQIVSAEKTDWTDRYFNFKSVRRVAVMDFGRNVKFGRGTVYQRKMAEAYEDATRKLKCDVVFGDRSYADLIVECKIKDWSSDSYVIPERTVWERKKFTRRYRNHRGDWAEETYYETVPVTYPPRRVDVSDIAISFEVYDARTGQMVFGRDDVRRREDRDAHDGMFKRICNSFFEDLGKKLK